MSNNDSNLPKQNSISNSNSNSSSGLLTNRLSGGLLKRTSSTHSSRPVLSLQSCGSGDVGGSKPQNARSVSADRAAWASIPTPRTREKGHKGFIPLPAPKPETLHEQDEEDSLSHSQGDNTPARALSLNSPLALGGPGEGEHVVELQEGRQRRHSLDVVPREAVQGRITVVTGCDAFRRSDVIKAMNATWPEMAVGKFPDVIHLPTPFSSKVGRGRGDVFIFDYGVIILWALEISQELEVLRLLLPCQVKPLLQKDVQKEDLSFQYSSDTPPCIQNDLITISRGEAKDPLVKLAISHALAQSSKLAVYEERVWELVDQVRYMPESLATHGEIRMSQKQMAKLMGQVFIQKSEVNLLSSVLDTPDFFWSAPDALQTLYYKVTEYLALQSRIDLCNSRTKLIQSMLGVWSDQAMHSQIRYLDHIIILLIMIEVILAALDVVGYFYVSAI